MRLRNKKTDPQSEIKTKNAFKHNFHYAYPTRDPFKYGAGFTLHLSIVKHIGDPLMKKLSQEYHETSLPLP